MSTQNVLVMIIIILILGIITYGPRKEHQIPTPWYHSHLLFQTHLDKSLAAQGKKHMTPG